MWSKVTVDTLNIQWTETEEIDEHDSLLWWEDYEWG